MSRITGGLASVLDHRAMAAVHGPIGWSRRNGLFFALVALVIYFSVSSEFFLTTSNLRVILLNVAIVGIVAVPGAMLVLAGYVDLSVGSMAVLSAVLFGKLFEAGASVGVCFLLAIAAGAAWGLIQGFLVTYLGFSAIVVSLGGLAALRGLALYVSDAFVVQGFGDLVTDLGNAVWWGLPIPVWILLATFLVGGYVWFITPVGRHLTAIGANKPAAHALGINVRRMPLLLYVASGIAASVGGLILMSQLDAASMSIGQGLELDVLTAILLGGVSFVGGRGSLFGVLIGVLFIGVIQNGLLLIDVSAYLYQVCVGAALVAAAGLDVLYQRLDRIIKEPPEARDGVDDVTGMDVVVDLDGRGAELDAPRGEVVLEARHLEKHFGAVQAVRDVSFELRKGEVAALVGDNGAGKTTIVNMLSGVHHPDHGDIIVEGARHTFDSPAAARRAGVETVFQGLALIPTLDIAANVFIRRELFRGGRALRWLRIMDRPRMRREVREGFTRLRLSLPVSTTKVEGLSGGQRQAVAIARAVLWGNQIVLLDEPAAALGVRQTEVVLSFVEQLKQHGVAVVLISHNMQHVLRVADRIIIMRLGQKAYDGPRSAVDAEDLILMITGARDAPRGAGDVEKTRVG